MDTTISVNPAKNKYQKHLAKNKHQKRLPIIIENLNSSTRANARAVTVLDALAMTNLR